MYETEDGSSNGRDDSRDRGGQGGGGRGRSGGQAPERNDRPPTNDPAPETPAPTGSAPEVAELSVTFLSPWVDPPNTFRATSIAQMYKMTVSEAPFDFTYEVGLAPSDAPVRIVVENKTVSTDLQFTLKLPSFLSASVNRVFVLDRRATMEFTIALNEPAARNKSRTTQRAYLDNSVIEVLPLLVNGPVYVQNSVDVNAVPADEAGS